MEVSSTIFLGIALFIFLLVSIIIYIYKPTTRHTIKHMETDISSLPLKCTNDTCEL